MEPIFNKTKLNEQQLEMIQLLRSPLPEEYFVQLKRLAVQLLGKQLDKVIVDWEEKNNIASEYYEKLSRRHQRAHKKK